jgi:hypothetical protein
VLEDRLNRTGATESKFLQVPFSYQCICRLTDREELNTLRVSLDTATAVKRQLELTARQANETCERLTAANDVLSAKALSLAEDAEQERRRLTKKWTEEVEALRKHLADAQEEADEGKFRGQAQRIQLLDEVS